MDEKGRSLDSRVGAASVATGDQGRRRGAARAELTQPGEETREAMRCFLLCPHSGSTNRSWALLTHRGLCSFPGPVGPSPELQPCSHHCPQLGEPVLDQKQALSLPLGTGLD